VQLVVFVFFFDARVPFLPFFFFVVFDVGAG